MRPLVLFTITTVVIFQFTTCMIKEVTPSCSSEQENCEFSWTVDYLWTMNLYNRDPGNEYMEKVFLRNGTFYKYNVFGIHICGLEQPVNDATLDRVAAADGRQKLMYAINNEFPGPNIVVYEGQTMTEDMIEIIDNPTFSAPVIPSLILSYNEVIIIVNVTNNLVNEGITFHWHGIQQIGTPWMDGVSMLSQNPIYRGQTFSYRFKAQKQGTYWYYSNHGVGRGNGLAGALIILPRTNNRNDVPDVEKEFNTLITDWFLDLSSLQAYALQAWYGLAYQNGDSCYNDIALGIDGTAVNVRMFESGLVNGKGWQYTGRDGEPIAPQIPLEKFHVDSNKTYKFRIVNTGELYAFRFSIDNHNLSVIAADGFDIQPISVESVIIYPGERYDVVLTANQPPNTYWIRSETLEIKDLENNIINSSLTLSILHYDDVEDRVPTSQRQECTSNKSCVVLGCSFRQECYDVFSINRTCVYDHQMNSTIDTLSKNPVPIPQTGEEIAEIFLNFHYQVPLPFHPAINGRQFKTPPAPLQLYGVDKSDLVLCDNMDCEINCQCTHIVKVKKGQIVQLVLTSVDSQRKGTMTHAVHIHGYAFHVLKTGFPVYDDATGNILQASPDIVPSEFYSSVNWENTSWFGDNIPGLNLKNPPIKDVIAIPAKGYVVVRFRADNPGYWGINGMIDTHQALGMAMILQVGEENEMPAVTTDIQADAKNCTRNKLENQSVFILAIISSLLSLLLIVVLTYQALVGFRHRHQKSKRGYIFTRSYNNSETTSLIQRQLGPVNGDE